MGCLDSLEIEKYLKRKSRFSQKNITKENFMRMFLMSVVFVLGFQWQANAQSVQSYVDSAYNNSKTAASYATAAIFYQRLAFLGSAYRSIARSYAASAALAAQTTFSVASAASTIGTVTPVQQSTLLDSLNRANTANTVANSIISGSNACGTRGEGCPILQ